MPFDRWASFADRLRAMVAEHDVTVGLASLKLFRGVQRWLRFNGNGVCLAIDVPTGERARRFFAAMDNLTLDVEGIVNVAKDSRLSAEFARRVFPDYDRFREALAARSQAQNAIEVAGADRMSERPTSPPAQGMTSALSHHGVSAGTRRTAVIVGASLRRWAGLGGSGRPKRQRRCVGFPRQAGPGMSFQACIAEFCNYRLCGTARPECCEFGCRDRRKAAGGSEPGGSNVLLVPAGCVEETDSALPAEQVIETTVRVNYLNLVKLVTECARWFESCGCGEIVGFSSIAASVPRRRNMAYASAKAGLETYLRSLRHYFSGTKVIVQVFALGYVDTAMSFGQRLLFPRVSPQSVARRVLRTMGSDIGVVFYPRYWRCITALLRLLPWPLYRRLRF